MSILTLGDNIEFVNDAAKYPVQFLKKNAATNVNEASDPTNADSMFIAGYGHFYKTGVFDKVSAQRPRAATFNVIEVDSAIAAQFTLGAFDPGKVIRFRVELVLVRGMKVEFFRSSGTGNNDPYGRTYWFPIKLRAGDTTATVLDRLNTQISDNTYQDNGTYPFTTTFAGGKFTLTGTDTDYRFKLLTEDRVDFPSPYVTAFAPNVVSEAYEGLGQGTALHTLRLETEARNEPYMSRLQQHEGVTMAASYDFVQWRMLIARTELAYSAAADSGPVTQTVTASFYIRHGIAGNETFLTNLLTFLSLGGSPVSAVSKQFNDNTGAEVTQTAFLAVGQAA